VSVARLDTLIATVNPPRVIATSHGLQGGRSGPILAIPTSSSWNQTSHGLGVPVGYTANHAAHASQREYWSKLSYTMGSHAETISLDISAVHDAGPKRKGSRGTPISVSILRFVCMNRYLKLQFRISTKGKRIFTHR
jgi:hypothetical protein